MFLIFLLLNQRACQSYQRSVFPRPCQRHCVWLENVFFFTFVISIIIAGFYLVLVSAFEVAHSVPVLYMLLLHAGAFWYFHNQPNVYRIFNVHLWSFCMCIPQYTVVSEGMELKDALHLCHTFWPCSWWYHIYLVRMAVPLVMVVLFLYCCCFAFLAFYHTFSVYFLTCKAII